MPTGNEFDVLYVLIAFAGGIFGAAIGALPAFILCGLSCMIGVAVNLATGDSAHVGSNVFLWTAWGPFLGPQISFAGGAAAAAYAARKGKLDSGRNILAGLMGLDAPDVLLVGGVFGVIGYLIRWGLDHTPMGWVPTSVTEGTMLGGWTNSIALTVVLVAMLARLVFSKKGLLGKVRKDDNRWRPSDVAAWLPWQSKPLQLILIGIAIGVPAAYIVKQVPHLAGMSFGIAVVVLLFLQFGVKTPVIHHIALAAEIATLASGGNLCWGVTFGLLGVFFGEIHACLWNNHGDTHVDPPSASLATTFIFIALFSKTGLFATLPEATGWWLPVVVAAAGYGVMAVLRRKPNLACDDEDQHKQIKKAA